MKAGPLLSLIVALLLAELLSPWAFFALAPLHVPFHRVVDRALMIAVLAAALCSGRGLPWCAWWSWDRDTWKQLLLGYFIAFVSVQAIVGFIVAAAGLDWASPMPHTSSILATALLAALVVPLLEETFFRGFVQTRLVARCGAAAGIPLTAMIYALAHFIKVPTGIDTEPVRWSSGFHAFGQAVLPLLHGDFLAGRGLNLLILGLILGLVFLRSGRLWIGYALHGGFIVALLTVPKVTQPQSPPRVAWLAGDLISNPLTTVVLLLLLCWLWFFYRAPWVSPETGPNAPLN